MKKITLDNYSGSLETARNNGDNSPEAQEPESQNSFVLQLQINSPFIDEISETFKVRILQITSDYEERSVHSVCMFVMTRCEGSFLYPLSSRHIAVFYGEVPDFSEIYKHCRVSVESYDDPDNNMALDYYHHYKKALIYALYVFIIKQKGWFSFAVDDNDDYSDYGRRSEGVIATFDDPANIIVSPIKSNNSDTYRNIYINVISLDNLTVQFSNHNSIDDKKQCLASLYFKTSCYRAVENLKENVSKGK
mmetsp:Transcript_34563/g.35236  ORF Transcript_34563/g.35236 Transcript_34563/m.35236 type:complete len:249 (+) Transcript_34563:63-809(+)